MLICRSVFPVNNRKNTSEGDSDTRMSVVDHDYIVPVTVGFPDGSTASITVTGTNMTSPEWTLTERLSESGTLCWKNR